MSLVCEMRERVCGVAHVALQLPLQSLDFPTSSFTNGLAYERSQGESASQVARIYGSSKTGSSRLKLNSLRHVFSRRLPDFISETEVEETFVGDRTQVEWIECQGV